MESLALRDGRPCRRQLEDTDIQGRHKQRGSPRLPTPEASRCSNEALDVPGPRDLVSPLDRPSHSLLQETCSQNGNIREANTKYQNSSICSNQHSQFRTNRDHSRTLPPIQTVSSTSLYTCKVLVLIDDRYLETGCQARQ